MKKFFLAAAVLIASVAQAQELKQGSLSNVTRLTTDDGVMYENPRWSPDGSKIAFTKFGYEGLFVMNSNGSAKQQLSDGAGVGYLFQWGADSRELLIRDTRWEDTETAIGLRRHAIWALDLDGNKVRMTADAEYMQPAAWRYSVSGAKTIAAPDAKILQKRLKPLSAAVAKEAVNIPSNKISFYFDSENLYLVDEVGEKTLINEGTSLCPTLSPDGKKVAFNQLDDVVVMNIDGTGKQIIGRGFNPCWVNDSQIVFELTTDDGHEYTGGELYIANIKTGSIKQMTTTSNRIEMQPRISPDGSKIIFTSFTDGQIYVADFK